MSRQPLIESISRECIQCDAKNCNKVAPQNLCSRRHTVYYCSVDCQRSHWDEHRPLCLDIDDMRKKMVGILEDMDQYDVKDVDTNVVCAICLEEKALNPIIIPKCKHVFCFRCLETWKKMSSSPPYTQKSTCPSCRNEILDEKDLKLKRVRLNVVRASREKYNPKKKQEYYDAAISDLDDILSRDKKNLQVLFTKAEILSVMKHDDKNRQRDAISILKEIIRFHKERIYIYFGNPFDVPLLLADAYMNVREWTHAIEVYKSILTQMHSPDVGTPSQQRQVFMGFCRCFYEIGEYQKSIQVGKGAIEMNRHFPGIHKYVAMAHRENGDLDDALIVMNQAILYETPWDDENKAKAKKLYDELRSSKMWF